MSVLGIDAITYGVEDLSQCKQFMLDWGLSLVSDTPETAIFECLNGCQVQLAPAGLPSLPAAIEEGSTLREVVWGVENTTDLDAIASKISNDASFVDIQVDGARRIGCTDPNGLAVRFQVTRKKEIDVDCAAMNTWQSKPRMNAPAPVYNRATPIEVGHVVFFVADVNAVEAFYQEKFGFVSSDRYPDRGAFMRCSANGGHHDLFLLQLPNGKRGLNHVAFTVRDIHEVFGGGMHISRCGWETQIGPGRHPVSSAYFWYFKNPAGALIEYYADEDQLTAEWEPREFEPGPTVFAEWAIDGGLDGTTRRPKGAGRPQGKFLTEKN
ncbi:glyoxalase [Lampropedia puyangensis]|uniref:Glyoxalase n=1 Tax=Lampropedia puyangensis TaxID=1330072 RepID=A0A4V4GQ28_9BURK|nr:VOC family protein [Lampropedia puyangensis]THT96155.1 glyoxalase [Lampropedia puyangensis]